MAQEQAQLLIRAAEQGDLATVQSCKSKLKHTYHTNLEGTNAQGLTALQVAVNAGHLKVVQELIVAGADISRKYPTGENIAHRALGLKHMNMVRWLIQYSSWNAPVMALLNMPDQNGLTILMHALRQNDLDLVKQLIAAGVALPPEGYFRANRMHGAIMRTAQRQRENKSEAAPGMQNSSSAEKTQYMEIVNAILDANGDGSTHEITSARAAHALLSSILSSHANPRKLQSLIRILQQHLEGIALLHVKASTVTALIVCVMQHPDEEQRLNMLNDLSVTLIPIVLEQAIQAGDVDTFLSLLQKLNIQDANAAKRIVDGLVRNVEALSDNNGSSTKQDMLAALRPPQPADGTPLDDGKQSQSMPEPLPAAVVVAEDVQGPPGGPPALSEAQQGDDDDDEKFDRPPVMKLKDLGLSNPSRSPRIARLLEAEVTLPALERFVVAQLLVIEALEEPMGQNEPELPHEGELEQIIKNANSEHKLALLTGYAFNQVEIIDGIYESSPSAGPPSNQQIDAVYGRTRNRLAYLGLQHSARLLRDIYHQGATILSDGSALVQHSVFNSQHSPAAALPAQSTVVTPLPPAPSFIEEGKRLVPLSLEDVKNLIFYLGAAGRGGAGARINKDEETLKKDLTLGLESGGYLDRYGICGSVKPASLNSHGFDGKAAICSLELSSGENTYQVLRMTCCNKRARIEGGQGVAPDPCASVVVGQ